MASAVFLVSYQSWRQSRTAAQSVCAAQVSHGAIQFMVYEELKALTAGAGEYAKDTGRSSLSAGQISVIGAASKLAASVVTYPSQVAFSLMTPDLASFVALPDVGICGAATNMQLRPALAKVALHCTHVTTGGTAGYISSSVLEFTSAVLPSELIDGSMASPLLHRVDSMCPAFVPIQRCPVMVSHSAFRQLLLPLF